MLIIEYTEQGSGRTRSVALTTPRCSSLVTKPPRCVEMRILFLWACRKSTAPFFLKMQSLKLISCHLCGGQKLCYTLKILIHYLLGSVSLKEIHFKVNVK